MKVKFISDSCCDLWAGYYNSERVSIAIAPLSILIGEKEYIDCEGLDVKEMITTMKACKTAVKTACPSPEAFACEMADADNIICLTLSAHLSGSYNSAKVAADAVKAEHPEKNIFVLDSQTASSGMTLILDKIAALIESDDSLTFDRLVAEAIKIRNSTKVRFFLQDLSNFIKTGRISKVMGLLTTVINIKPVLGDNGSGEIVAYARALGTKKALSIISKYPEQKVAEEGRDIPVIISHCYNESDTASLVSMLVANFGLTNVKTTIMRGLSSVYANDKGLIMAF